MCLCVSFLCCFLFVCLHFLFVCLFSKDREKVEMELEWCGGGEDLGRGGGRGTVTIIYCMKLFSIKINK